MPFPVSLGSGVGGLLLEEITAALIFRNLKLANYTVWQSLNKLVKSASFPSSSKYIQFPSSQKPPDPALEWHNPAVPPVSSLLLSTPATLVSLPFLGDRPSLPHVSGLCSDVSWSWYPDGPCTMPSCMLYPISLSLFSRWFLSPGKTWVLRGLKFLQFDGSSLRIKIITRKLLDLTWAKAASVFHYWHDPIASLLASWISDSSTYMWATVGKE